VGAGATLLSGTSDLLIGYVLDGRLVPASEAAGLPSTLAIAEAADLGLTEFNGVAIDESTVIARYTFVGDANLDGQVDALDYERIDLAIDDAGVLGSAPGDLSFGNGMGVPLAGRRRSRAVDRGGAGDERS
jgi:hypothetical protein